MGDLIATLREFAQEPGALFYVLDTAPGFSIIWADDIRAADDDALRALVLASISPRGEHDHH